MAGLFDFEKFYTEKTVKTEIHLDLSGIDLKSTASSESANEDGTADDVGMNEYVTNNVMYKISGIGYNSSSALIDVNASIFIVYHLSGETVSRNLTISECCPIDVLLSANMAQIPETSAPMGNIYLITGKAAYEVKDEQDKVAIIDALYINQNGVRMQVNDITVAVVPRVRLQNLANMSKAVSTPVTGGLMMNPLDANFYNTNQNPWDLHFAETWVNRALGGLGFYGSRYLGWKWYNRRANQSQTLKRGVVMGYDTFRRRLNDMSKILEQNNMGLKVTYYDDALAEPVRDREGKVTDPGDWTYDPDFNRRAKWDEYYTRMGVFVNKCNSKGDDSPLPNMKGTETVNSSEGTSNTIQNATALIPNVSDAFKKYFYHADELADEFNDRYFDTYNSIMSIRGVQKFMSSSLKRKLRRESSRLMKTVEPGTPVTYYVDLASCANMLALMEKSGSIIAYPSASGSENAHFRAIANYGGSIMDVHQANYYTNPYQFTVDIWTPQYVGGSWNSAYPWLYYANTKNQATANAYADKPIQYKMMTWGDMKKELCDYFTAMINKRNGQDGESLSEGDHMYSKWWYGDYEGTVGFYVDITAVGEAGTVTVTKPVNPTFAPGENSSSIQSKTVLAAEYGATSAQYGGSAKQFVDFCEWNISCLNAAIKNKQVGNVTMVFPGNLSDDVEIPVAQWDECSISGDVVSQASFVPAYETYDNVGDIPNSDIDGCIDFAVNVMGDAIDEIDTILSVQGMFFGPAFLLIQKLRIREAKEDYAELMDTINKIRWYQAYTGESVFENRSYVGDRNDLPCPYLYMPARFMIPVLMYKKVRVRYRRFFRTRHKMVKRSIGVRWVEVAFVDNDVYESYPQNSNEPQQFVLINKNATIKNGEFVFEKDIEGTDSDQLQPQTVTKFKSVDFALTNAEGVRVTVEVSKSSREFKISDGNLADGATVFVYGAYMPLDPTNKSDELTPVRIEYKMPYLPYDSEIRRWAFENYGAFDQSKYASITREVPAGDDKKDGWRIFKPSSKRIGDLRAQLGIYDAASILLGILRNAYGAQQVEVVDTMRSIDDQALMCTGSNESTFLSWHNYGLAIKILINDPVTGLAIEDGSDDMKKLIDIAEGFTIACANGAFGKPLNVVWCGRLKMGANIFDWEFLPIGVNHKDAPKFRDAMFNQEDPVMSLGFVDVDAAGYVYNKPPVSKVPYVLRKGSVYTNAIIINGHHYVSPANIRNYKVPNELVLQNILEFVNLVNAKQGANGTAKTDRASMTEWKALNDKSYKQLIMYYGMIGSLSAAKALIAGEYVEKYRNTVDSKFSEDYVAMVQDYLGSLYADAKIYIESVGDGGAWISVKDGKIHIKTTDLVPDYNPNSKGHFFGEKLANVQNMKRGMWVKGVFYTEDELVAMGYKVETVSDESFIEGFDNDGNVERGDARLIHSLIATQIKNEFDKIREMFDNFGGNLMYDHFKDGSNANMEPMLENEFGIIAGQDLIDFDKLRNIYRQKDINDNASKSTTDGTIKGAGANEEDADGEESIYEKVVSNAQLAGIRKASLTKEHVQVNARANALTTEQLYKLITKGRMTSANDLLKR